MNRISPVLVVLLVAVLASSIGCSRKPDDSKISGDIQSRFSQDSGLSSKQLSVQASNGVVTLAGFVDNDVQREAAARQAASVEGVREVVNNLQVGSPVAAAIPPLAAAKSPQGKATETKVTETKPSPWRKFRPAEEAASKKQDTSAAATPSDDAVAENSEPADPPPADAPTADPVSSTPPTPPPPQPQKVTIEQGTSISIRLIDSIDTGKNQIGDTFHASLNLPLLADGSEAIPAGTDVAGHVVDVQNASQFEGQSLIVLQLDTINTKGKSYTLQTDQYRKEGSSRSKSTAEKVGGGAVLGGIIGAIAGGGKGAVIGTAAGAGAGGAVQAGSKNQQIKLPSETVLNFTLQAPLTVTRTPNPDADRPKLGDSQ
ncbi:MAG: BON domain-containing protein [Candidatus Sulfotelmatobacter sp.]|jgi:hypothetical protein